MNKQKIPRLSPGIIASSIEFFEIIRKYEIDATTFLSQHPSIDGTSTQDILNTSLACQWIMKRGQKLELTDISCNYNMRSSIISMQKMLFDFISNVKPAWAALLTKGRMESVPFLPKDIQACFFDADLMIKPPNDALIAWWDKVAGIFFEQRQKQQLDIGRLGEKLSFTYEYDRVNTKPIWQSVESNLAGYDILSKNSNTDNAPLLIEAKASIDSLDNAIAHITKHEWDTACRSKYYLFHFWLIAKPIQMAVITVDQIKENIPRDIGEGYWEYAGVPFKIFGKHFQNYNS